MKRLLVVTPNFLPNTSADMHRARLMAPRAQVHGWTVEILCVDPADNDSPLDSELMATFPRDIRIHRVRARRKAWHRWIGMNSMFRRCVGPIAASGAVLLANDRYDLVYFSNTAFDTFALGPIWKRRFGVPYVLDYQDPWQNDYYRKNNQRPPGGWLKYWWVQARARRAEPRVVADAAGITAVSRNYIDQLKERNASIPPAIEIPFPSDDTPWPMDMANHKGLWTSVGRGGDDLAAAASALFRALVLRRSADHPEDAALRCRFVGTSYAPSGHGAQTILPIAVALGWKNIEEHTDRVSFLEARRLQAESEGLIVLLSDDPAYQPSKLAGLVTSGKPLLIVAPPEHRIHRDLAGVGGVTLLEIGEHAAFSEEQWAQLIAPERPQWHPSVLSRWGGEDHSRRLFEFFDECVIAGSKTP